MKAPLRNVVSRELWHSGTSMSHRAGTITVTNHYKTKFVLECGHVFMGPHAAPVVAKKRCKKCVVRS